jgi:hypothetical protein
MGRLTTIGVYLTFGLAALVNGQSNAVSAHSVSDVPAPSPTESAVSVHSLSFVSNTAPLETDVSAHPVSLVPAPQTLSGSFTEIPFPTSATITNANSRKSNKGTIAGGVLGGLVAAGIAAMGAFIFLRLRRQSKRHWRNRTTGVWQDREGNPSRGPVYVGFDRPFDGYSHDTKIPVASPTTPTVAPLFIREPRIAHPYSTIQRGHVCGSSTSHYRDDSATYLEMHGHLGSDSPAPLTKF